MSLTEAEEEQAVETTRARSRSCPRDRSVSRSRRRRSRSRRRHGRKKRYPRRRAHRRRCYVWVKARWGRSPRCQTSQPVVVVVSRHAVPPTYLPSRRSVVNSASFCADFDRRGQQ